MTIGIINYGMGNIGSIQRKMNLLNVKSTIIDNINDFERVDKLILPGVGHFGNAMEQIKKMNLEEHINEFVLVKKKPILGICLGMQLMAKFSEEGNERGFGWFDANVLRFKPTDKSQYKIPHIGWNEIKFQKESILNNQINDLDFYFVHSFHFKCNNKLDVLATTNYEIEFVSAIQKDNIFGCQFHPEKSHTQGEKLLKNFINL